MTVDADSVSTFWWGEKLSPLCWLCLKSFVDHGHKVFLYCFDQLAVPDGVEVRDASEIVPRSRVFYYQTGEGAGSVAGFANLFRYKLLLERGGWWVDTDVLCLRPDLPKDDLLFGWEGDDAIGNAVLKIPKRHPLAARLYEIADREVRLRAAELKWSEIGPRLLTRIVHEQNLEGHARPVRVFYPTVWTEWEMSARADKLELLLERTEGSVFFHLWHEMFRRAGHGLPPAAGSYLSAMIARHGVAADASF